MKDYLQTGDENLGAADGPAWAATGDARTRAAAWEVAGGRMGRRGDAQGRHGRAWDAARAAARGAARAAQKKRLEKMVKSAMKIK